MLQLNSKRRMAFNAAPKCHCVVRSRRSRLHWKENLNDVMGLGCVDSHGNVLGAMPEPAPHGAEEKWKQRARAYSICPCVARSRGLMKQKDPAARSLWAKAKHLWEQAKNLGVLDPVESETGGEVCKSGTECPPPPPPGLVWSVSSAEVLYPVRAECACQVQVSQPARVAA